MSAKYFFLFTGVSGLVSVAMGAFGAHALRGKLEENLLRAFETGVSYQMSHTLVLLCVCLTMQMWGMKPVLQYSAFAFILGIILFSGSLYGLALTGSKWLGPVTPVGGIALMLGWSLFIYAGWENAR